jgi:transcriptional regulator with XRE-family HTH domain
MSNAISDTVQEGLGRYSIGDKVRALRLRKKLGLVELGNHTGLSPALLSKIERGRLFPTLPTLLRISLVFGVGLEHFFTEDKRRRSISVVRGKERQAFPEAPGSQTVAYHFQSLDYNAIDKNLNAFLAEFHPVPADKIRLHHHAGAEFIYVIKGKLVIRIGEEETILAADDSITFDSSLTHGYRSGLKTSCSAFVVTVP